MSLLDFLYKQNKPIDYVDSVDNSKRDQRNLTEREKLNSSYVDTFVYNRIIDCWDNLSTSSIESVRKDDSLRFAKEEVVQLYKKQVCLHIDNNILSDKQEFVRAIDRLALEVSVIIRVAEIFAVHSWLRLPNKTQDIVRIIGGKTGKLGKRKKLRDKLLSVKRVFNYTNSDNKSYESLLFKDYVQFAIRKKIDNDAYSINHFLHTIELIIESINPSSVKAYEVEFKSRIALSRKESSNLECAHRAFRQSFELCFESYSKKNLAWATCEEVFEEIYHKENTIEAGVKIIKAKK